MKKNNPILFIVDDEAPMRSLLHDFFVSQGYEVKSFASAQGAVKALRGSILPTAIISDIRMYPVDGIDLLRVAKRDFRSVPVFLFTGNGSPEEKAQALKLGASHYLAKPFSLTKLKDLVDDVVSKKEADASKDLSEVKLTLKKED